MRRPLAFALSCLTVLLIAGCMSPSGDTPAQKRKAAAQMRSDTLTKLYAIRPSARAEIKRAVGYAVFSNVGVNLIFLSAGDHLHIDVATFVIVAHHAIAVAGGKED